MAMARLQNQVLLICFFLAFQLKAADKTFSPASGQGFWSEAANWQPAGLPDSSDNVRIPQGVLCRMNISLSRIGNFLVEPGATAEVIVAFEQISPGKIEVQGNGVFDIRNAAFRMSGGIDFTGSLLCNEFTSFQVSAGSANVTLPMLNPSSIGTLSISGQTNLEMNQDLSVSGSLNIENGSRLVVGAHTLKTPSYSSGIIISEASALEFIGGGNISLPSLRLSRLIFRNEGFASLNGEIILSSNFTVGNLCRLISSSEGNDAIRFTGTEDVALLDIQGEAETGSLIVEKSSGSLQLTGNSVLSLTRELDVRSGVFNLAGKKLILKAQGGKSARLAPLGGSITSAENLIFERSLSSSDGAWYWMGPTSLNRTFSDWNDNFETRGPFSGASVPAASDASTVFVFNGAENPLGSLPGETGGWRMPSSAQLEPGKGYRVFLPPSPSNPLVNHEGPPLSGKFLYTLQNNPAGFDGGGWNFLSNPYPSAIDWNSAGIQKKLLEGAVYTFNPSLGQVATYLPALNQGTELSGTNSANHIIGGGQGFFVRASGLLPQIELDETAKSVSFPAFQRITELSGQISITFQDPEGTRDENLLRFQSGALSSFNAAKDARKLSLTGSQLSMKTADNIEVCIYTLPSSPGSDVRIPMTIKTPANGSASLKFTGLDALSGEYYCFLNDRHSGRISWIQEATTSPFDVSADPESRADGRFEIIITKNRDLPETIASRGPDFYAFSDGKGKISLRARSVFSGQGRLIICNSAGKEVYREMMDGRELARKDLYIALSSGIYSISWAQEGELRNTRIRLDYSR